MNRPIDEHVIRIILPRSYGNGIIESGETFGVKAELSEVYTQTNFDGEKEYKEEICIYRITINAVRKDAFQNLHDILLTGHWDLRGDSRYGYNSYMYEPRFNALRPLCINYNTGTTYVYGIESFSEIFHKAVPYEYTEEAVPYEYTEEAVPYEYTEEED